MQRLAVGKSQRRHRSENGPKISRKEFETTISSLPPELLLVIFEFCYEYFQQEEERQPQLVDPSWHCISAGLDPSSMRPTSAAELFDRFRSPSRFPFALAGVSTLWNDLLFRESKYWTELIYTIGSSVSDIDLAKTIQNFERYPRDRPLDFIILVENASGVRLPSEVIETENIQLPILLTGYLNNHFPRLRSVSIETHSGETFPDIMGGWRYRATNSPTVLLSTVLLSQQNNYIHLGRKYPRFQSFDQRYHSLRTLSVHGLNLDGFFPSILNGQISKLEQLIVSDYMFIDIHDSLTFAEFCQALSILPHLHRLKLQNLCLSVDPGEIPSTFTCNVLELQFESVTSYTISKLYHWCDFPNIESLHFTRCSFHQLPFLNEMLILDDVEVEPLCTTTFENDLGEWGGSELWIGRYRGPSESLLDVFRKYNQWTNDFQCPWMDTLYLYQIPNLSLKRLKKVLKSRNKGVDYDDPHWQTNSPFGPAIRKLSIDQCGIAPLTEKDMEWFSSMLVEFIYIP